MFEMHSLRVSRLEMAVLISSAEIGILHHMAYDLSDLLEYASESSGYHIPCFKDDGSIALDGSNHSAGYVDFI